MSSERNSGSRAGAITHGPLRLSEIQFRLAEATAAYKQARDANDSEKWAGAEKRVCQFLELLLDGHLSETGWAVNHWLDGVIAGEIDCLATVDVVIRGRVYCWATHGKEECFTEPVSATIKLASDGHRLESYSLRFGSKSEQKLMKSIDRIQKAPVDSVEWDFSFNGP